MRRAPHRRASSRHAGCTGAGRRRSRLGCQQVARRHLLVPGGVGAARETEVGRRRGGLVEEEVAEGDPPFLLPVPHDGPVDERDEAFHGRTSPRARAAGIGLGDGKRMEGERWWALKGETEMHDLDTWGMDRDGDQMEWFGF